MKFIKNDIQLGTLYSLEEGNKTLEIIYATKGNLDLYWTLRCSDDVMEDSTFTITKENYNLYVLFEQLYIDIKDINFFNEIDYDEVFLDPDSFLYMEDEDDRQEYLQRKAIEREQERERYRNNNVSRYNELFDEENKTITWYSDETSHDVANVLTIKKEEDSFKITFSVQPEKDGFDRDFYTKHSIPVRFRNSGSSYDPFNIVFMRMYHDLQNIDDVNDLEHQVTLEEYLYNQQKIKKIEMQSRK